MFSTSEIGNQKLTGHTLCLHFEKVRLQCHFHKVLKAEKHFLLLNTLSSSVVVVGQSFLQLFQFHNSESWLLPLNLWGGRRVDCWQTHRHTQTLTNSHTHRLTHTQRHMCGYKLIQTHTETRTHFSLILITSCSTRQLREGHGSALDLWAPGLHSVGFWPAPSASPGICYNGDFSGPTPDLWVSQGTVFPCCSFTSWFCWAQGSQRKSKMDVSVDENKSVLWKKKELCKHNASMHIRKQRHYCLRAY